MSMVVKGDSALFDQAKHAIPVTTLISQDATCNTCTKHPSMDEARDGRYSFLCYRCI